LQKTDQIMRIQGPNSTAAAAPSSATRRSASGTFSLETGGAARPAAMPSAVRNIGGIDTLLALQGVDEAGERRRRAVKRGRGALDALDALKLGLLSGTLDAAALARLKSTAAGLVEPTGDPGLDTVMAEIALRVDVELAKTAMPGERAKP
jgi:hypothetical protein